MRSEFALIPAFLLSLALPFGGAQASGSTCVVAGPTGNVFTRHAAAPDSLRTVVLRYPEGGHEVSQVVRDTLVEDVLRLAEARAILKDLPKALLPSIASGLGQAAALCNPKYPEASHEMGRMVAEINRIDVAQAFQSGSSQFLATPLTALNTQCYSGEPPVSAEEARRIMSNPLALLSENQQGGSGLSSIARNLAITDPANVSVLLGVLSNSNELQRSALAAGFGQAVMACEVRAPVVAQNIQRAVASINDTAFASTFLSVTGNPATAAISLGTSGISSGPGSGGPVGSTSPAGTGFSGLGAATGSSGGRQPTFQFSVSPDSISSSPTIRTTRTIVFRSISP